MCLCILTCAEMAVPMSELELRDPRTGANVSESVNAILQQHAPHLAHAVAVSSVFPSGEKGGTAELAHSHGTSVLGRLPLDPSVAQACEQGKSLVDRGDSKKPMSAAASVLHTLAHHVLEQLPVIEQKMDDGRSNDNVMAIDAS